MNETKKAYQCGLLRGYSTNGEPDIMYIRTNAISGDEIRVVELLVTYKKLTIGQIAFRLNDMGAHERYEHPRKKTSTRKVYQIIRNLREAGLPLVGDVKGIWVAKTVKEIEDFAEHLEQKARSDIRSMMFLRRQMLAIAQSGMPSLFDAINF